MKTRFITRFSTPRLMAASFLSMILIGSLLLMLPISTASGKGCDFLTALFTATSATCVTGLSVVNTATFWSAFGKVIILMLIQIGGLGLMTIIAIAFILARKKIGISERKILKESAGNMDLHGVVLLMLRIVKGTFLVEGIGAVLLACHFVPQYGWRRGIWYGVFHSISAFCNAGFDVFGDSLLQYHADVYVLSVIMLLIITGGIGFLVWDDLARHKFQVKMYSLHTKLVLVTTFFLIVFGTLFILFFESKGVALGDTFSQRVLSALFLSVSSRTAGFNSIDMTMLSDSGSLITMILMLIGGSPASTAGGVKTTTVAVMILAVLSLSRGDEDIVIFKKTLKPGIVSQAMVVLTIYLTLIGLGTLFICYNDSIPLVVAAFETISAVATVGLSIGATAYLSVASKIIIIILMYAGRIGGYTMVLVLREKKKKAIMKRPVEKVLVG